MLTVSNLSKSFGVETLFKGINFTLNAGERLGLVGPNGSGKTTLLRILTGQERADGGSVRFDPPDLQRGYLPQGLELPPGITLGRFLAQAEGDLPALEAELADLAAALAHEPGQEELQRRYDAVLARLELTAQGAGRAPAVLAALGLDALPPDTPAEHLSGGQKTRLALAGLLLSSPRLLLLDEPTNHLDIGMLEWLEDWLSRPPLSTATGILIVSHDRAFLDRTATGILELDPLTHGLRAYAGNYSAYLEAKLAERERQRQAYSDQQEEIARLRSGAAEVRDKARFRKGGKADSGDKFAKGFFANRSLETMRRAKALERRLERLLTVDRLEKPRSSWQMKLEFGETPASGRDVVMLEDLAVGYRLDRDGGGGEGNIVEGDIGASTTAGVLANSALGDSPLSAFEGDIGASTTAGVLANSALGDSPLSVVEGGVGEEGRGALVLFKELNLHVRQGARVALVGPNGAGKTTLLRTIAGMLPPLAGKVRLGANVRLGYMAQEQEDLDPQLDAFTTLQRRAPLSETQARAFLHKFLFAGDEVFIPVGNLSFGERSRLSLAVLAAGGCNLLLLDEPVNHLDIPSRARFEQALAGFEGTIVAVVHDRYFIEGFATEIWETGEGKIRRWEHEPGGNGEG